VSSASVEVLRAAPRSPAPAPPYRLRRSDRRTLEIAVLSDGQIEVRAPKDMPVERIEARLRGRARWIARQRRSVERAALPTAPREFRSGESFRYLGRQYRLRVCAGPMPHVRLVTGRLEVTVRNPADKSALERALERWFHARAKQVLPARVAAFLERPAARGLTPKSIALRRMRTRWGSCSSSGRILLNTELIHLPTTLIDFVIAHELVHLRVRGHGRSFERELDRLLPIWRAFLRQLNPVTEDALAAEYLRTRSNGRRAAVR
jgi:predicted metal-dependent hydrolase